MADKTKVVLSTIDGQTEAWESTYQAIVDGSIDATQATNRIRSLRGVYILRVEGPTRLLGLLARLGKDNETLRDHAGRLAHKVMGTLSPESLPTIEGGAPKE